VEHDHHHHHDAAAFPTGTDGLDEARATGVVELADGSAFQLTMASVAKRIGKDTVRMLAYNGSIPGPTLRVPEGARVSVEVTNRGDLANTVHWHGLRLDNRYDGTHETQAAIPVGGSFTYEVEFPDPGIYWYHPHVREDYGQELGLYGAIIVVPREEGYWPPAHRELALTLDDIRIEDGAVAPFSPDETTFAAMGRFGNVLLVGGETDRRLDAEAGEVIRFYLVNTANTRVFRVGFTGARMKLVGGDSGRYERETLVEAVVLAPSERAVVDVLFGEPGTAVLEHRTPERTYAIAGVEVSAGPASPLAAAFETLRANPEWAGERDRLDGWVAAAPDKTLAFLAEMDLGAPDGAEGYACPMHPEVASAEEGRCPKCGMKLLPVSVAGVGAAHARHDHAADGIEWEDDMVEVNRLTTPANTRWMLVDRETGAVNDEIDWRFRVGDRVKIRLVNEMDSDHPMQHPFHVHGAGRFLVLTRDGVPEANLVWKDTVLVRTGETVDLLLDVTNPGRWMAHCHIAEHHESGMMLSFVVDPA